MTKRIRALKISDHTTPSHSPQTHTHTHTHTQIITSLAFLLAPGPAKNHEHTGAPNGLEDHEDSAVRAAQTSAAACFRHLAADKATCAYVASQGKYTYIHTDIHTYIYMLRMYLHILEHVCDATGI